MTETMPGGPGFVLEVSAGPHAGQTFELAGTGTFTLGRQPGLHVTLADDARLSRVHCSFEPTGGAVRVTDLGSRGGVFVNGSRVEQAVVSAGDEVTVGGTTFRVRLPDFGNENTVTQVSSGPGSEAHR